MANEEIKIIVNAKDNASGVLKNIGSSLASIGGTVAKAGLAAAATGAAALTTGLVFSVKAAAEAQDIQAQLNAVLKSTGGAAGVTADMVNDLATKFGNMTKFEDDAVIAGENMLLTFTGIGKDVFPMATEAMLNMSQAMGQDLQSSAVLLGKALNNPEEGLSALTRVGVKFTDEQEKLIKSMAEAGDVAGAQALILQELQKEFGGSAVAAGETFSGQLTILKNMIGNVAEEIGGAILPALTEFAGKMISIAQSPEFKEFLASVVVAVEGFVTSVIETLPGVITAFQNVFGWLSNNQAVVVGVLSILALAATAWGITTAIAAATAMAPFLPIIALIAAVGLAIGLFYAAWESNWGGIRDTVLYNWGILQSVFNPLKTWLETYIPAAIQLLTNAWNTVLLPAITTVWTFIQTNLFPLFNSVTDFINAAFTLAITAFAGIWTNVLLPAFTAVWKFIAEKVMPIFETVASFVGGALTTAFGGISNAISSVIGWLGKLTKKLEGIHLPGWMTPGSPTPWEIGLVGVGKALTDLSRAKLPEFEAGLKINAPTGIMGNVYNPTESGSRNGTVGLNGINNYNLTVNTNASVENIFSDFRLMKSWANV